jgi:hypothetical protein
VTADEPAKRVTDFLLWERHAGDSGVPWGSVERPLRGLNWFGIVVIPGFRASGRSTHGLQSVARAAGLELPFRTPVTLYRIRREICDALH